RWARSRSDLARWGCQPWHSHWLGPSREYSQAAAFEFATGSNGERLCCGVNAHVLGRNWKRPEAPLELFTEVGWYRDSHQATLKAHSTARSPSGVNALWIAWAMYAGGGGWLLRAAMRAASACASASA